MRVHRAPAEEITDPIPDPVDPRTRRVPIDPGTRRVPIDPGTRRVPIDPGIPIDLVEIDPSDLEPVDDPPPGPRPVPPLRAIADLRRPRAAPAPAPAPSPRPEPREHAPVRDRRSSRRISVGAVVALAAAWGAVALLVAGVAVVFLVRG